MCPVFFFYPGCTFVLRNSQCNNVQECCGILEAWTVSDQLACLESMMLNICYS